MTNKTLIALAVSAAVGAPAAQAAEFQVDEKTTIAIEGTLEPVYQSVKDATGDSQSEFTDNDSTLQFAGEHAWTDSTTGFFHIEYEWNFDEDTGGVDDLDSAELGIKGDFGTIQLGTYDSLYEDNVAELVDEFENGTLTEEEDGGEGNQITYYSPDFSGLSFGLEARVEGDGEDEFDATDDGGGDVVAVDPDDSATGLSAMIRYDAQNWGVVVGADNRAASYRDTDDDDEPEVFDDETTAGVGGYYSIADFRLSARFASESNRGNDNDIEYAGLMGSYDYGKGEIHLGVQDVSYDDRTIDDRTEVAAIVKHGVFDNLDVFAAFAQYDKAEDEDDLTEVGAIYSF